MDDRLVELKRKSIQRCMELLADAIRNGTLVRVSTKPVAKPLRKIDVKQS